MEIKPKRQRLRRRLVQRKRTRSMSLPQTFYDEKQKLWHGPERELFYDFNCSLGNVLFSCLKRYPKNICQISDTEGSIITNQEALNWSIQVATYLKENDYTYQDVVGIAAKNSTHLMPVVLGCFFNTTPFHAVSPTYDKVAIKNIFAITKPKIIFCDGADYEKICWATQDYKPKIFTMTDHINGVPKVTELFQETGMEMFYLPERLALGGDQTVAILCSSGTTGPPKAVCMNKHVLLQHSHLATNEDVLFSPSGIDWATGMMNIIWATTSGCKRIITDRPFIPEDYARIIKSYKVTASNLSPHQMALLLSSPAAKAENFTTLRFLILGGGAIASSTLEDMQNILENGLVMIMYGMSECGGVAVSFGILNGTAAGKLIPGIRVRIVDESGNNLGHNQVGEILIHTGCKWNGYYNNPVETKRLQDEEGWIHSGDLGYFNDDNVLFIVDRLKDTLKYQGYQYWPGEIEEVIMQLPDVVDVCVVGIFDQRDGDCAGALLVKKASSKLTEQDVKDHVAKLLPMKPKQLHAGVLFVDRLPCNNNGKKLKLEAKALLEKANLKSKL